MKRTFFGVAMVFAPFMLVSCYTDKAAERSNPTPFFQEKAVLITPAKSAKPETPVAAAPKTTSPDAVNILDVVNEKPTAKTSKIAKTETSSLSAQKIEDAANSATPGSASATPKGKLTHTVEKGETLWSIAKDYYGDGREYKKIVDANPGLNVEKLKVGQEIVIP